MVQTKLYASTMLFLALASLLIVVQSTNYSVLVDGNNIITTKPTPFYGFTIDWWTADDPKYGRQWGNAGALTVDFSNENFIALVAAISPSFLRIGGSPEDSIIYNVSGECLDVNKSLPAYTCSQTKNNYGCMTMQRWQEMNDFAAKTNGTLLFGLNGCYGRPANNTSMDFSNIAALFKATVNGIESPNLYGFEFANELQRTIDADTYATDFITVHKMIQSTFDGQRAPVPYLVGTDTSYLSYSQEVINNIQQKTGNVDVSEIMHSVTYHQYPDCEYPGAKGTVFDVDCLQKIDSLATSFSNMSKSAMIRSWMGEGSEHVHGGIYNVSDTFVDCFYTLYQLCSILSNGVTGTMRSDLIGGDYELIDKDTFLPNPSYWIFYVFKELVGDTLRGTFANGNVTAFAFDGAGRHGLYQVVLVLINFDLYNEAVVSIDVVNGAKEYKSEEYHLKSSGAELNSKVMLINDVAMEYVDGRFPNIKPVLGDPRSVTLDAATMAFVVLTPQ